MSHSHLLTVTIMSAIIEMPVWGALKMEILFETLQCGKCPELIRGPNVGAEFTHFNESVE